MTAPTLADMVDCVARELRLRRGVYARQVARGAMKVEVAHRETVAMTAVQNVLLRLQAAPDLFAQLPEIPDERA